MPPRKRTLAKSEDTKASEKIDVSNQTIGGIKVRWEWEDTGKWVIFATIHQEEILKALDAKLTSKVLSMSNGSSVEIFLEKLIQKNKTTGWERRIRCCVGDAQDYYTWQWLDENGTWNHYIPKTTVHLECEQKSQKSSTEIEACGREYTIDLTKMEQSNKTTAVVRKVQRVLSENINQSNSGFNTGSVAKDATEPPQSADTSNTASTSRSKKKSIVPKDEDSDEQEPPTKQAKKSNGRKTSGKSVKAASADAEETETKVKTIVLKGKAPVDPECSGKTDTAHVYHEGSDVYDVMLNQTNVGNNNNKFYLIQLLEEDGKKSYSVWFRWGRVGFRGQSTLTPFGPNLDDAKDLFCKKFSDKTKNEWSSRKSFKKVAGKYDMVKLDYTCGNKGTSEDASQTKPDVKVPDSKLSKQLQALIKLICDIKEMENAIIEMKYDAKKAPLGRLTKDQIKAGYSALKKIDALVEKKDFGQRLTEACNDFYTRIPHDFRMSRPPLIRTSDEVKEKMDLLEALGDIEIAMRLLQECKSKVKENPIDAQYKSLKCDLDILDKKSSDYQTIVKYVSNTHASTHNQYKMKVLDVFSVSRKEEQERFKDLGNRMLLWHGSRLTNMMGILSRGLRIAPPEAPVTGYMFGKGIYFADISSKSANYCFATKTRNVGLLVLSEVSLGNCNELLAADYGAEKLPKGKDSVKGLGKVAPDPAANIVWEDGTVLPVGKPIDTGVTNPSGYTLNYNEYIVYNPSQVKMRYIVQVQFDFS